MPEPKNSCIVSKRLNFDVKFQKYLKTNRGWDWSKEWCLVQSQRRNTYIKLICSKLKKRWDYFHNVLIAYDHWSGMLCSEFLSNSLSALTSDILDQVTPFKLCDKRNNVTHLWRTGWPWVATAVTLRTEPRLTCKYGATSWGPEHHAPLPLPTICELLRRPSPGR